MFSNPFKTAMIAALVFSSASAPAFADNNLGAAIVGGIIGGAIVNEANKKKKTTTTYSNTAARQQNRETQTALNYFGFPAGTPDGVLGAKSRAAISQYQSYMGFPATGQLTPYERNFLVSSYNRAQIGGPQVIKAMQSPQGVRGLLPAWRDEAMGIQKSVPAAAPAAPLGGIQPFSMAGDTAPAASLASHCSKISLLTNSNGGFVTLASLRDPDLALSEQFCLARTYAIGAGEDMVAKVQGLTPAQVDAQCDAFGPALAPYVAKLETGSAADVIGEVQNFVLNSNMSLAQLSDTARICLFSGYRRDKMEVALGSALLMVGIGQVPYAELVGHHLSQGFGVAKSAAQAQGWYTMAVTALEAGADPVFAPGQPERVALIKAAASGLGGGAMTVPAAGGTASGLPSFSLE